ncbi:hypothetical protein V5799_008689 [Amblyomma americanum]|uniref:Uncharacterized protein n=1 Tax=Amblyomma americanum TaxID=6943 RepID=A0AAQ4FD91_AMBAM
MLLSVSVLFVQKIQSLEASVGERAQKNKHLKEEVSKLQEKVHNLTSETAETRDAEALKRERIECLYREAKEENQFMRRAGSAAKAGVTPGHQVVREPVLKQEKTLFTSASSPSSGLKVAVMPAESSQGSSSSEVSVRT